MRFHLVVFEATGALLALLLKRLRSSFEYEFQDEFKVRNVLFGLVFWLPITAASYLLW